MYKIIEASSRNKLMGYINSNVDAGFEPLGGLAVTCSSGYYTYYQAVYKKQLADNDQGER